MEDLNARGIYQRSKVSTIGVKDFETSDYSVNFNDPDNDFKCEGLIFKECALVCQTSKVFILHKMISSLQGILTSCAIMYKPEGIRITETNKDGKVFISIFLKAENFLNYYCPRSFYFERTLKQWLEKFQKTKKVMNLLTITCKKPGKLVFNILDEKTNVESTHYLDEDKDNATSHKIELGMEAKFPFKIIVPVSYLYEYLRKKKGEKQILLHVTNTSLVMQLGTNKEEKPHVPPLEFESKFDEKISLDFKYWKKLVSMMNTLKLYKSSKVCIYFCSKQPFIYISQEIGNLGTIGYILARAEI